MSLTMTSKVPLTTITNGGRSDSIRYQRLLSVLEKALQTSRQKFDAEAAIREVYGDDAAIFGDDDNNGMLRSVLDSMLESVHDKVSTQMKTFLQEKDVEKQLSLLDAIIFKLEQQDADREKAESRDKHSARQALEDAKLPKGLSPIDMINRKACEKLQQEKEDVLAELAAIEEEIEGLEAERQDRTTTMQRTLQTVQAFGKELEKSADKCSMVS